MWQTHNDRKGLSEAAPEKIHCVFIEPLLSVFQMCLWLQLYYEAKHEFWSTLLSILKLRHIHFEYKSEYTINNSVLTASFFFISFYPTFKWLVIFLFYNGTSSSIM